MGIPQLRGVDAAVAILLLSFVLTVRFRTASVRRVKVTPDGKFTAAGMINRYSGDTDQQDNVRTDGRLVYDRGMLSRFGNAVQPIVVDGFSTHQPTVR